MEEHVEAAEVEEVSGEAVRSYAGRSAGHDALAGQAQVCRKTQPGRAVLGNENRIEAVP